MGWSGLDGLDGLRSREGAQRPRDRRVPGFRGRRDSRTATGPSG